MIEDVKTFLKSCLHCECTSTGFLIPRPLGEAVHGEIPNEVLHFDYLYMANAYEGFQYVLVLKEDFSSYCELVPLKSADSRTTADAVIDWCKQFGKPKVLVSDQGSHFKNNLIASITQVLGIHHHFTLAYVPWSNGTVERLNQEVLRTTRCLLSEFRLPVTDWPRVLPIVQMIQDTHTHTHPIWILTPKKIKFPRITLEVKFCYNGQPHSRENGLSGIEPRL